MSKPSFKFFPRRRHVIVLVRFERNLCLKKISSVNWTKRRTNVQNYSSRYFAFPPGREKLLARREYQLKPWICCIISERALETINPKNIFSENIRMLFALKTPSQHVLSHHQRFPTVLHTSCRPTTIWLVMPDVKSLHQLWSLRRKWLLTERRGIFVI